MGLEGWGSCSNQSPTHWNEDRECIPEWRVGCSIHVDEEAVGQRSKHPEDHRMSLQSHPQDIDEDYSIAEGSCSNEPALPEGEGVSHKEFFPSLFPVSALFHPLNLIARNQSENDECWDDECSRSCLDENIAPDADAYVAVDEADTWLWRPQVEVEGVESTNIEEGDDDRPYAEEDSGWGDP